MSEHEDDDENGGPIEIIGPADIRGELADYLLLKPYDTPRSMQLPAGRKNVHIPLLGTVRHYAIELVWKDETWDFLHLGTDLAEAKARVQALSVQHDVPIRRLFPKFSDVDGY